MTAHVVDDDGTVHPVWSNGDRIRKARLTVEMDQREFADQLGVKPGSLAAWETDRSRPRDLVAIAKRIELLTKIPAAWILGLDEKPQSPRPGNEGLDGGGVRRIGTRGSTFTDNYPNIGTVVPFPDLAVALAESA